MDLEAYRVLFMDGEILKKLSNAQRTLIVAKLNAYNPKLKVALILSFPGQQGFSIAKRADSTRFALVAETYNEVPDDDSLAPDEGVAETEDGSAALYRAVLYLLVSPIDFSGRNVFVAQTVFPALCALIDEMEAAPGIAFSSHPVYFLNLASASMPDSVRRPLMLLTAMGVGYVSVCHADFDPEDVPRELEALLQATGHQRNGLLYYSVDAANRMLTYTTSQFIPGKLLDAAATPMNWKFKPGSNEKFYWSEVLPIAVVAAHSGFGIDCSSMLSYLDTVRANSSGVKTSIKFDRTVGLFNYIKKISEVSK